jgi:hypothetical protein
MALFLSTAFSPVRHTRRSAGAETKDPWSARPIRIAEPNATNVASVCDKETTDAQ